MRTMQKDSNLNHFSVLCGLSVERWSFPHLGCRHYVNFSNKNASNSVRHCLESKALPCQSARFFALTVIYHVNSVHKSP